MPNKSFPSVLKYNYYFEAVESEENWVRLKFHNQKFFSNVGTNEVTVIHLFRNFQRRKRLFYNFYKFSSVKRLKTSSHFIMSSLRTR